MVDFLVGKIGETFLLAAQSDAAKELCNKILPSGEITVGAGFLIFPPSKNSLLVKLGRAIITNAMSLQDMPKAKDDPHVDYSAANMAHGGF